MALVALLACALAAYWAGSRAERFIVARTDVRDLRVKLRKARRARAQQRKAAAYGWAVLGALAVLALAAVLARRAHV